MSELADLTQIRPATVDTRTVVHITPATSYEYGPVDQFAPDMTIRTQDGRAPDALCITAQTAGGVHRYIILLTDDIAQALVAAMSGGIHIAKYIPNGKVDD